jgi:4-amino-4-deoxy-L-arabinose transferase-like glycosyltransferase
MTSTSSTQPSKFALWIGLLLAVNLLVNNHQVSLWDEDEAAYAGFAQQMVATGDWVNPNYPQSVIHRKTPLHFWAIGGSYQVFGENEFGVRFSSALAIFLTCLLVYFGTRNWLGQTVAERAAVILATTIQLPLMGKIAFTDATLLLFETGAMIGLVRYLYQPHWRWNVLLWTSMALGMLTKGPPIVVLVGGTWLLLAIFHPQRKNLIGTHPWLWGWLALLPFAYWAYLSYQQDYALWSSSNSPLPFVEWWNQAASDGRKIYLLPFLWDWYVLKRVGGAVLGQTGFPGYHLVILTVAFLTWLPFWPSTLKALGSRIISKGSSERLVLVLWLVMGWFFWELMSSKLPSYALAAQPALALLMALQLSKIEEKGDLPQLVRLGLWVYSGLFLVVIIGLPIGGYYVFGSIALGYLLPMTVVLLGILIQLWRSNKTLNSIYQHLAVFGGSFMLGLWLCVAPLIEQSPIKSFDNIIAIAAEQVPKPTEAQLVLTGLDLKQFKISLVFYAQQTFGSYQTASPLEAFQALQSEQPVVLVVGTVGIEELEGLFAAANLPFEATKVAHQSTDDQLRPHDYWIVSNQ